MNTNFNRRNILLAGTTLAAASALGTSAVAAVPTESPTRWKAGDDIDAIRDHWLLTIFVLGILAAIAWFMPAAIRSIGQLFARRRTAYLASEAWSFAQLRTASNGGDPTKVYFALLNWLRRFEPLGPGHNLETLKKAARDPGLDREIASLERNSSQPRRSKAPRGQRVSSVSRPRVAGCRPRAPLRRSQRRH
jgi:hypothetical protein